MKLLHWFYFLSLEHDFVETLNYAELAQANYGAYSNEYAKLLLLSGSELDVVAKLLCAKCAPSQNAMNIMDYRSVLTVAFPGIHTVKIEIPRYRITVEPWADWGLATPTSPSWWKAHTNVKHKRDEFFSEANQENTLNALCGLLAILLYYHKDEKHLQPYPEIFDCGFPSHLVTENRPELPGMTRDTLK